MTGSEEEEEDKEEDVGDFWGKGKHKMMQKKRGNEERKQGIGMQMVNKETCH